MAGEKEQKRKRWKYQIELGPMSLVLSGLFILFLLTWIFVLGIFVGRGFLPEKITMTELKDEVNGLWGSGITESNEEYTASDSFETEPELAFYNRLTTKKDEIKNSHQAESVAKTNQTGSGPMTPAVTEKTHEDDNIALKAPEDTTPSFVTGQYTVQVASIEDQVNAEKTVKQLIEKGFDAYYYETVVKGKRYYRIRCGKFSHRLEALQYSLKIEQNTGLKGYVTAIE